MQQYLSILGRQPKLSLAELISLAGSDQVSLLVDDVAMLNVSVDFDRIGGSIKFAEVITTLPGRWKTALETFAASQDFEKVIELVQGKFTFGLSVYGAAASPKDIFARALDIKKTLRQKSRSVRVVTGQAQALSAAEIIHNHLVTNGAEIICVEHAGQTTFARTIHIQNIEAYGGRDFGRPARSAKVGMLPPKLAQIMINLANPTPGSTILDPFCGTGVVLQEAALMEYKPYGTDISPEMIQMSRQNMDWLEDKTQSKVDFRLEEGNAEDYQWIPPIDAVVTEGYLGPVFARLAEPSKIEAAKRQIKDLTLKFLSNLSSQIPSGSPVCLTLPAWKTSSGFVHTDIIDQIQDLGYTLVKFSPVNQEDLLYWRPGQAVGRQIVSLRRK